MLSNATLTLRRRGDSYDATTGYRQTSASPAVILKDQPCLFSQSRSGRSVNADGIRDYSKQVFALLIEDLPRLQILPGDQATVTVESAQQAITETYTVNSAVLTPGITEAHWECEIERIKTQ